MNTLPHQHLLLAALLCCLATGCAATRHAHDEAGSQVRANQVVTVADDFIVDVYLNGVRVPDERRELRQEIFGATVERINVEVHTGDWLVFHVVNDRLRWGGCEYFAAAGLLSANEYGFVSETKSGNWSACDDPAKTRRFIAEKQYFQSHKAQPIAQPWADGTPWMKKSAGDAWPGEPLWGLTRDTWLKVIVR
jgi:hypothetical protein